MAQPQPAPGPAAPGVNLGGNGKMSLKIPLFHGTETRGEIAAFISKADAAIKAGGYGVPAKSEEAASYIAFSLRGAGFEWFDVLQSENPAVARDYPQLMQAFKDRWVMDLTLTEIQDMKAALKQTAEEGVLRFADRCAFVQKMENANVSDADKATNFFKAANDKAITAKFLEGLRTDIKERVLAQSKGCNNIQDYRQLARDIEVALQKDKQKKVNPAATPTGEVAATKTDMNKKTEEEKEEEPLTLELLKKEIATLGGFNKNNRGTRGRGRGQTQRGGFPNGRGRGNPNRKPGNCNYCQIPGHWARECRQRLNATQRGNFGQGNRGTFRNSYNNGGGYQFGQQQQQQVPQQQPGQQQQQQQQGFGFNNNLDIPNALQWNPDF